MRNILKILISLSILFLIIGTVAAAYPDTIKPLEDYTDFDANGYSNYTTNNHRYIIVEEIGTFDEDFIDEWFNNHSDWEYKAYPVGDNIYYQEDNTFGFYGYEEAVVIDGKHYMVSINQDSKLSPSEKTEYLKDLQEFNKLNKLEPISVT